MKKKTMVIVGSVLGTRLATAIITSIIIKRATKIEIEKQLLIENVRAFMKANKVGKHDYDTQVYVKGLSLNGKSLSEKQIEKLLSRV